MKTNKLFDLAYKLYPESPGGYFDGEMMDGNSSARHAFVNGYETAEKDHELTWGDIDLICKLADEVKNEFCDDPKAFAKKFSGDITPTEFRKVFNMEVLSRYNEIKGKESESNS